MQADPVFAARVVPEGGWVWLEFTENGDVRFQAHMKREDWAALNKAVQDADQ